MQYSGLNCFHHVIIGGIGMTGCQYDTLFCAIQREFMNIIQFGSNGHKRYIAARSFVILFHLFKINRDHIIGIQGAVFFT